MAILGAHMSISGGYRAAVERAAACGCDCVQLFTKNNNQWHAKQITPEEAEQFRKALSELGVSHPAAHDAYLINLASPDKAIWRKSVDAFIVELRRADTLGIPHLVAHPGAYTTSSEALGLGRVVRALDEIHGQTRAVRCKCLLETTAGQGTSLGWRFEHLATILDGAKDPDRLGICFDTCHVFAAGYPMGNQKEYRATMTALNATVGLDQIRAFHLNDSRRALGSRVDRHAHIGRGMMGLEPFRLLLADRRFRKTPMYLETPKGEENGVDLDAINLSVLRALAKSPG
ncbi:MAG: deoxyribonuclease IV [Planctomycetes bacterium RBG_16_64_12]|nr:MAG: deoxyribonuclease IV [Planctomycetes bacterium RBG_16_64_12]